ncbi:sister chromatid cohesion protein PDS5 homolog B-like [Salvelinus sp. IW2-2015]|uniref:sister chromatid cohesion protein PDS5 homolog B-like n=1 Tax=Salvelinus sp. IW2-2015 TaxID=2691554 RepID=UPI0038D3FA6B
MRGTGTDCTRLVTHYSKRLLCRILLANAILRYASSHCSIDSQSGSGTIPGSTNNLSTSSQVVSGSPLGSADHSPESETATPWQCSSSPPSVLLPVLQTKAKRGPPRQAKYAIHCIHAMFTHRESHFAQIFEPLQKGLDLEDLDQLITPLTTLGHLALLAPEQFAAPLKSLVANFIVKDLLMSDRIPGKKTTKLWVPDDEVSSETLAKSWFWCPQTRQGPNDMRNVPIR